jgi:hypothetical protein
MWLAYCATVCLWPAQAPESPSTPRKTNPPQWEYKVIERDQPASIPRPSMDFDATRKNCVNELNKLGSAGWEFAAVANGQRPSLNGAPDTEPYYVYFRRATDQARRQKWEYKLVDFGELLKPGWGEVVEASSEKKALEKLADESAEGWQLTTWVNWPTGHSGRQYRRYALLKRVHD